MGRSSASEQLDLGARRRGGARSGRALARPFLTIGRQSLKSFLPWADRPVTARVVDRPDFILPTYWTLLTSRGPYSYPQEHRILIDHRIDLLITKDSGGSHTAAKLAAAADLHVGVVIIARPVRPQGSVVATVAGGESLVRHPTARRGARLTDLRLSAGKVQLSTTGICGSPAL